MLFMYIHTHTPERCFADKPQETAKMAADFAAAAKQAGIKSLGVYSAPHQHTMFVILEADDIMALEKAVMPMTLWGDAELIPIVSMEQALAARK